MFSIIKRGDFWISKDTTLNFIGWLFEEIQIDIERKNKLQEKDFYQDAPRLKDHEFQQYLHESFSYKRKNIYFSFLIFWFFFVALKLRERQLIFPNDQNIFFRYFWLKNKQKLHYVVIVDFQLIFYPLTEADQGKGD